MKSKNFKKKLVLNKKTIADLNNAQLGLVKGGVIPPTLSECAEKCPTNLCTETCLSQCVCTGTYCFTCDPKCPTYTLDGICS
jgi:hypothetical protein